MTEDPMAYVYSAMNRERFERLFQVMRTVKDSSGVLVHVSPEELIELMPQIAQMVCDLRLKKQVAANSDAA